MKEYFILQLKLTHRSLRAAGIHPALGYIAGLTVFIGVTEYLFAITKFAGYLILLSSLSFLFKLSEKSRTDFLVIAFGIFRARNIRMVENIIISFPFTMVLILHTAFFEASVLVVLAVVSAIYTYSVNFNLSVPTPFSKHPYEIIVGFRNSFFIFPVTYILTIIAVGVDNQGLGIFAMLVVFLTSISFFTKPEDEYYVWVHSFTPKGFLWNKLKLAARNVFMLNLPVLAGLLIAFPRDYALILLFFFTGLVFLWTFILGKYSAYPDEMNLPEGILLILCIFFPPLLLALMPFFYGKSVKRLNFYLND